MGWGGCCLASVCSGVLTHRPTRHSTCECHSLLRRVDFPVLLGPAERASQGLTIIRKSMKKPCGSQNPVQVGPTRVSALAIGAQSVGAFALGAIAIGSIAVGAIVVGRLIIKRARIKKLYIDELEVGRLRVREHLQTPEQS